MKPAWDALMKQYSGSDSIIIGDVDCTAAGKPLCDANGVKGYPTIKHGDPDALEDYKGGRDAKALKAFAATLKPSCSPANIHLCDDEKKAQIEAIQAMPLDELNALIKEGDRKVADAEATFKAEVEKLQATYQSLMEAKDAAQAEVADSGLSLYKAVVAAKKAAKKAGHEDL